MECTRLPSRNCSSVVFVPWCACPSVSVKFGRVYAPTVHNLVVEDLDASKKRPQPSQPRCYGGSFSTACPSLIFRLNANRRVGIVLRITHFILRKECPHLHNLVEDLDASKKRRQPSQPRRYGRSFLTACPSLIFRLNADRRGGVVLCIPRFFVKKVLAPATPARHSGS